MVKKNKEVAAEQAAEPVTKTEDKPKRRPVHTIRVDEVSLSIWPREAVIRGEKRTFYSVSAERSYKDRMGQYQYTRNFDPESLPKLVIAVQQASEYLHHLMNPDAMRPEEEGEQP